MRASERNSADGFYPSCLGSTPSARSDLCVSPDASASLRSSTGRVRLSAQRPSPCQWTWRRRYERWLRWVRFLPGRPCGAAGTRAESHKLGRPGSTTGAATSATTQGARSVSYAAPRGFVSLRRDHPEPRRSGRSDSARGSGSVDARLRQVPAPVLQTGRAGIDTLASHCGRVVVVRPGDLISLRIRFDSGHAYAGRASKRTRRFDKPVQAGSVTRVPHEERRERSAGCTRKADTHPAVGFDSHRSHEGVIS